MGYCCFFLVKNDTPIVDQQPADKINEKLTVNLTIDEIERNFIVYLKFGYNNADKLPTVLALHGGTGNREGMIFIEYFFRF